MLAAKRVLNLQSPHETTYICCYTTAITEDEFKAHILWADVIVTQPISLNYRDHPYLSARFIIDNSGPACKIVIFGNCHFEFYYPDLVYYKHKGETLHVPCDYHYLSMIQCYREGATVEDYIKKHVQNPEFRTSKSLFALAEKSLGELERRTEQAKAEYMGSNVVILPIAPFIRENYQRLLLFYSVNHPSKYLLQYIGERLVDILQIDNTINYNEDPLCTPLCILYKCIQAAVTFDIDLHQPLLSGETTVQGITRLYYNSYLREGM